MKFDARKSKLKPMIALCLDIIILTHQAIKICLVTKHILSLSFCGSVLLLARLIIIYYTNTFLYYSVRKLYKLLRCTMYHKNVIMFLIVGPLIKRKQKEKEQGFRYICKIQICKFMLSILQQLRVICKNKQKLAMERKKQPCSTFSLMNKISKIN